MLSLQMDSAYVTFPNIEKKKRAGDRPSHRVFGFLTIGGQQEHQAATQMGANISEVYALLAARG